MKYEIVFEVKDETTLASVIAYLNNSGGTCIVKVETKEK